MLEKLKWEPVVWRATRLDGDDASATVVSRLETITQQTCWWAVVSRNARKSASKASLQWVTDWFIENLTAFHTVQQAVDRHQSAPLFWFDQQEQDRSPVA